MQSVVVRAAGDLAVEERPAPRPGRGEVLLNVTHGGICGSDLHYWQHGRNGEFTVQQPLTLGHEIAGTVAEDPAGEVPAGTAVTVHPATPCTRCRECVAGRVQVCRDCRYLGSAAHLPHTQGGFSQQLTVRATQLRVLPSGVQPSRAVLAEPLAVALHGLARAGGVRGARVLVSGAGPIGLLAIGAARAGGAEQVWATDLLPHPLQLAKRAGANSTVLLGNGELPGQHFDIAVEASGSPAAFGGVLDAVRRGGTVAALGTLPGGPLQATLAALVSKEIELRGSFRFHTELDDALRLLASTERFDEVVTHSFPVAEAAEAMRVAADPAVSGKVLLRFAEP